MRATLIETQDRESFLQLLLNENLCADDIYVPGAWVREAGGINKKLGAKRKYELLLRIASKHGFSMEQMEDEKNSDYVILRDEGDSAFDAVLADCYIVGKYSGILQQCGYFDVAVSGIIAQSQQMGIQAETLAYLEQMIGRKKEYDRLEEAVSPILIYKGSNVCNNLLNIFAEELGNALKNNGEIVEYFDEQSEELAALSKYIGRHFKAIIGVQTYLFQVKLSDGVTYLHECIKGPKFHLILDHPIWLKHQMEHDYEDFYVLSHDRDYVRFVEQNYRKKCIHFPIPGIASSYNVQEKKYDLTFVGSMGDYRQQLQMIREMEAPDRYLANRFLAVMRKEPELAAADAFDKAFKVYEKSYIGVDKIDIFYRMRKVIYLVMDYYRYQILKTILDGGIRLDVFGDSWISSPFVEIPNLVCHPSVSVKESLKVFAESRMSLNVMSWHKSGFTERVANIMLAHTVLVTDKTIYIAETYQNGKEMLMFELNRLDDLPQMIKTLLANENRQKEIAEAGYQKTVANHTWERSAKEIQRFLEDL